jgi:hypothetical protein
LSELLVKKAYGSESIISCHKKPFDYVIRVEDRFLNLMKGEMK